jgi:hypothetical protein
LRKHFVAAIVGILLCAPFVQAAAQSFRIAYQDNPRDPVLRQMLEGARNNRMLEGFAEALSRGMQLNQPIVLGLGECGRANAFYRPDRRMVVMCLELFPDMLTRLDREYGSRISNDQRSSLLAGALAFVFLHEIGHALIHVQNLPVLGREEDAADQISTFLLINELGPNTNEAIAGGLWFFSPRSLVPGYFSQRHLSDEHALMPQRAANLACWAFGREPNRFAWALQSGRVTRERAMRCQAEYEQLSRSVRALLKDTVR